MPQSSWLLGRARVELGPRTRYPGFFLPQALRYFIICIDFYVSGTEVFCNKVIWLCDSDGAV